LFIAVRQKRIMCSLVSCQVLTQETDHDELEFA
jgi:hypothetical protein